MTTGMSNVGERRTEKKGELLAVTGNAHNTQHQSNFFESKGRERHGEVIGDDITNIEVLQVSFLSSDVT